MSRQSHRSGACPVDSGRDGGRHGGAGANSTPVSGIQYGAYTTLPQAAQSTDSYGQQQQQQRQQPAYDAPRAWAQPNPEVQQAVNDPRLNYAYQPSASTGHGASGSGPHQQNNAYANQYQQPYAQYQGAQQGSNSGVTAHQLYTSNYGQEPSNRTEVWKGESQREGPWYGKVQ